MHYLIYTRVSPKDSAWTRMEVTEGEQAAQCRAYIEATDPEGAVVDTVADVFETGDSSKRPGWQKILRELKSGKAQWDVLVMHHLDRFARSMADAVATLELLHQQGKEVIATAQGLDTRTPHGRSALHVLLSLAQMEHHFTSERARLKMTQIATQGLWPVGTPPFGYKRGKQHDNKLYVDEANAETVRQIFIRYRSGAGSLELARTFKIPKNKVLRILKNRVYLGLICYDGHEYQGQHEALITPDLFDEVQQLLPGHGHAQRPKAQTYPYLLTGLVYCQCGQHMSPTSAYGRDKRYHYYSCTDKENCRSRVRAETLEAQVLETLKNLQFTQDDLKELQDAIRDTATNPAQAPELSQLQKRTDAAQKKREKLLALFTEELVDAENAPLLNQQLSQATADYNALKGRLAAFQTTQQATPAVLDDLLHLTQSLTTLSQHFNPTAPPADLRIHLTTWVKEIRQDKKGWSITLNLPGAIGRLFRVQSTRASD